MKIALISGDSSLSGAPSHVLQLARALKSRGIEVLVITPPGALCKFCAVEKIPCTEVPMQGPFDRKADHKIREILAKFNPDIAHFHGVRGGWLGRLAARKLPKVKKIYTEHLWTKDYHLNNPAYEQFQLNGLKFMERWTDMTIAVSNAVKDFLTSRGYDPKKIVVIPNGIGNEFINVNALKKPKGTPYLVGSVGSLNRTKNYRNAILAIAKIKKDSPELNIFYQIIGEGPEEKRLKKMVERRKLTEIIHFISRAENIGERLSHFTIFLNVSLSESFGLAVGEAMAVGLPVVVSNVEGLKTLVTKDTGIFVDPRKPEGIAKGIMQLINDRPLRLKMGAAAKKRIIDNFSEDKMIKKTVGVYNKVLKSRGYR